MILWVFTIIIYLVLIIIDIPIIRQSKCKKVIYLYVVLIITAFTITVLSHVGIKVPSPVGFIKNMVDKLIGT